MFKLLLIYFSLSPIMDGLQAKKEESPPGLTTVSKVALTASDGTDTVTVYKGDVITLTCTPDSSGPNLELEMFQRDSPSEEWGFLYGDTQSGNSFTFTAENSYYMCKASEDNFLTSTLSNTVTANFKNIPTTEVVLTAKDGTTSFTAENGQKATLVCTTNGDPVPVIKFYGRNSDSEEWYSVSANIVDQIDDSHFTIYAYNLQYICTAKDVYAEEEIDSNIVTATLTEPSYGLSTGAIVGIVLGSIAVFIISFGASMICRKKKICCYKPVKINVVIRDKNAPDNAERTQNIQYEFSRG